MKYRLLAADMDGTLLNEEGIITDYTEAIIRKVVQLGIVFVPVTGRANPALLKYSNSLPLNGYAITYNGAEIFNCATNRATKKLSIDYATFKQIIDIGNKYHITMLIWCSNELYCNELNDKTEHYQRICGVEPLPIKEIDDLRHLKITKVLWYADENTIQTMQVLLQGNSFISSINVFKSQPCFLEIVNSDVSKGKTLSFLANQLGIPRTEIFAIGDGQNDIDMLEYAGFAIAMGNADPLTKQVCDYITDTNNRDGAAKAIEMIINNV